MPFEENQAEDYRALFGNPGTLKLHEALSDIEDWLDYEAAVVEEAADDIEDSEISEAAEEQAEAMEEAAEAVGEAADAARDTAAEVFNDTGVATAENVGDGTPEGDAIGGNPFYIDSQNPDNAHNWTRRGPFDSREDAEAYMREWFPDDEKWQLIVTQGNPVGDRDPKAFGSQPGRYRLVVSTPSGNTSFLSFETKEDRVRFLDGLPPGYGIVDSWTSPDPVVNGNPAEEGEPIPAKSVTEGNPVNGVSGVDILPQDGGYVLYKAGRGFVVGRNGEPIVYATHADAQNAIATEITLDDFAPVVEGNPGENPLPVETEPDTTPESTHPFFRPVNAFGRTFGGR